MVYTVIDIGSNTIRFNVYNYDNYKLDLLFGKKNVAGLASYITYGHLNDRGIKKLEFVLNNQLEIIKTIHVDKVYAFASASLRKVDNAEYIVKYIERNVGLEIEIISQEDEAKLGFKGVKLNDTHIAGVTVDIGGGSTEISTFSNNLIDNIINLNNGCLSMYNKYVSKILPTESEIENMEKYIKTKLDKKTNNDLKSNIIIGLGGTIRATGNILQEYYNLPNNSQFTYDQLTSFYDDFKKGKKEVLNTILQVTPERIHTIFPGLVLFKKVCEYFSCNEIFVSSTGLREGFLLEKLKG